MKRGADVQITKDNNFIDLDSDLGDESSFATPAAVGSGLFSAAGREIKQPKSQKTKTAAPKPTSSNPFASLFNTPAPAHATQISSTPNPQNAQPFFLVPPTPAPKQTARLESKPVATGVDEFTKEWLGLNFALGKFIHDRIYVPFHTDSINKLSPVDLSGLLEQYSRHLTAIKAKYNREPKEVKASVAKDSKQIPSKSTEIKSHAEPAMFQFGAVADKKVEQADVGKSFTFTPFKFDTAATMMDTQATLMNIDAAKDYEASSNLSAEAKPFTFQSAASFSVGASPAAEKPAIQQTPQQSGTKFEFKSLDTAEKTPKPPAPLTFQLSSTPSAAKQPEKKHESTKPFGNESFEAPASATSAPSFNFGMASVNSSATGKSIVFKSESAGKPSSPERSPDKQTEDSAAVGFKPSAYALSAKSSSGGFGFFSAETATTETNSFNDETGGWKPGMSSGSSGAASAPLQPPQSPPKNSLDTPIMPISKTATSMKTPEGSADETRKLQTPKFVSFGTPAVPASKAPESKKESTPLFGSSVSKAPAIFLAQPKSGESAKQASSFSFGTSSSVAPAFSFPATKPAIETPETEKAGIKKPAETADSKQPATFSFSFGSTTPPSFGSANTPAFSFGGSATAGTASDAAPKNDDNNSSNTPAAPKPFTFAAVPAFSFSATAATATSATTESTNSETAASKPFTFTFGPSQSSASKPIFGQLSSGAGASATTSFQFNGDQPKPKVDEDAAERDATEGDDDTVNAEGFRNERSEDQEELLKKGEGEEDETTVLEFRCKIFRFDPDMRNLGIHHLKINHKNDDDKIVRLLCRQEGSGKVGVNARITAQVGTSLAGSTKKDIALIIPEIGEDGKPKVVRTVIRCKDEGEANSLKALVDKIVARLKIES